MVNPIPTYISPERLERLAELADVSRLRAALYPVFNGLFWGLAQVP
ncbi:hypothetical protein [Streptomyces sp. NPDC058623]